MPEAAQRHEGPAYAGPSCDHGPFGFGPRDTTSDTVAPALTSDPAAGVCAATLPAGTVALYAEFTAMFRFSICSPSIAARAAASAIPRTFGMAAVAGGGDGGGGGGG